MVVLFFSTDTLKVKERKKKKKGQVSMSVEDSIQRIFAA